MSGGSGDYVIAFSTARQVRRHATHAGSFAGPEIPHSLLSPLFLAAVEATEEAIYNSLCMATSMRGFQGTIIEALPREIVRSLIQDLRLSRG